MIGADMFKKTNLITGILLLLISSCGNSAPETITHNIKFEYRVAEKDQSYEDSVRNLNELEVTKEYKLFLEWEMSDKNFEPFQNYIVIRFIDPDLVELNRSILESNNAFGDGINFRLVDSVYRAEYLQTPQHSREIFNDFYVLVTAPSLLNSDKAFVDVSFEKPNTIEENVIYQFQTTGKNFYKIFFRLTTTNYQNVNDATIFFLGTQTYKTLRVTIPLGNLQFNINIYKETQSGVRGDLLTSDTQVFSLSSHPNEFSDIVRKVDFNVMNYLVANSNFNSNLEYLSAVEGTSDARTIIVITFLASGNYRDTVYERRWEVGN
jgi:hypothetical protein